MSFIKPRSLRIRNYVRGETLVQGAPRTVARWYGRNPVNWEDPWDPARRVERCMLSGTWYPLQGLYASWFGELVCEYRKEAKKRDSDEVEMTLLTRNGHPVKSNGSTNPQRRDHTMAKTKAKNKKKNPDADEIDDEELAGLEEELKDLETEDDDEPDEVDDDEDDEEEEAPKRKSKSKKGKGKKLTKAERAKARRAAKKAEAEEEDEDDEDDEDEEEEAPKRKKRSKSKKGKSKSAKSNGKGKSKSKKAGPGTSAKDLGMVGTAELAEAAGVDSRTVRVYLRKNEIEKNEEVGRYAWASEKNKEFKKLAKAIAADAEDEDDDE